MGALLPVSSYVHLSSQNIFDLSVVETTLLEFVRVGESTLLVFHSLWSRNGAVMPQGGGGGTQSVWFLRLFCRMRNRSLVSEREFTRLVVRSILGS